MKKSIFIKNLFQFMFLVLAGAGCKKDFIQLVPISQSSVNVFYDTESDIVTAVNAIYAVLQKNGLYSSEHIFAEIPTDNATTHSGFCAQGYCDFDNLQMNAGGTAASGQLDARWNNAYAGIYRANMVLQNIDKASISNTTKARSVGEVKFLRALLYFNLVRSFGPVPLLLNSVDVKESFAYGRESVSKIYDQILMDLNDASGLLSASYTGANIGRATSGAVNSLLGEVYLTQKKYDLAEASLKKVVDGPYSLLSNYADVFAPGKGNNAEIVFAVQFKRGNREGSIFNTLFAPDGSGSVIANGATGGIIPTNDLRDAFEPGDARFDISIRTFTYSNGATRLYSAKFLDPGAPTNDADNDWIIYRYAGVLLMYAEALNEQNKLSEAEQVLKQVRDRALLPTTMGMDQSDLRLAIEREARVELCFEGHRWWDLIRTDRAEAVLNQYFTSNNILANGVLVQFKPYKAIFPIPQTQIDVNPSLISQNSGY